MAGVKIVDLPEITTMDGDDYLLIRAATGYDSRISHSNYRKSYNYYVTGYTELLALTPADFEVGDIIQVTNPGIAGLFKVKSGSATDDGGVVKTNSTWNTASKHFERIVDGDIYNVKWFSATGDGSTNDTAAIQDAIDAIPDGATLYFPVGNYKVTSQLLVSGREGLTFKGEKYAKILATDGSYIALLFDTYSYNCTLDTLQFYGTNNTTPAITLVKSTGDSAYFRIMDCEFAYASICVLLAKTYIVKLVDNVYSNSDIYIKGITSEGSNADLLMSGETFGTTTIGSNATVDLKFLQSRMSSCYFELQGHTKPSMIIRTGSQRFVMNGGSLENSGEIQVEGSCNVSFSGVICQDAYTNSRTYKLDGGAVVTISGGQITYSSVIASMVGINSTAATAITGNLISNADIGVQLAGSPASVSGNVIAGCTTGLKIVSGGTASVIGINSFSGNTTDIDNANGGPNILALNYATTISDAANNGTLDGNYPYRGIVKSPTRGNTAGRPTLGATSYGHIYMDTTLDADGKPIWWTGTVWVDATGAVV